MTSVGSKLAASLTRPPSHFPAPATAFAAVRPAVHRRRGARRAPAKGTTLHAFGIGHESLDFVVDRGSHKPGLYTPGTQLLIFAPDKLFEAMPDCVAPDVELGKESLAS
jgi:hypothetical protein